MKYTALISHIQQKLLAPVSMGVCPKKAEKGVEI